MIISPKLPQVVFLPNTTKCFDYTIIPLRAFNNRKGVYIMNRNTNRYWRYHSLFHRSCLEVAKTMFSAVNKMWAVKSDQENIKLADGYFSNTHLSFLGIYYLYSM